MNKSVAVIDDEQDIRNLVDLNLTKSNFSVSKFSDAASFLKSLESFMPDVIILDLMLPDMDGIDVCKHLKSTSRHSNIPIIMLTAKAEESDKIVGLELGADDYVTKPFSPKELVARVKAVLRRNRTSSEQTDIRIGPLLMIVPEKFSVYVDEKEVMLTTTEFKILELLSQKPGHVFSRNHILEYLWGVDKYVIDRTVDVHIKHLREKIGEAGTMIKSIRGIGYKIEP